MSLEKFNTKKNELNAKSDKELNIAFLENRNDILKLLNDCYFAFGLLDIIDNSSTSNAMKYKVENILTKLNALDIKI